MGNDVLLYFLASTVGRKRRAGWLYSWAGSSYWGESQLEALGNGTTVIGLVIGRADTGPGLSQLSAWGIYQQYWRGARQMGFYAGWWDFGGSLDFVGVVV